MLKNLLIRVVVAAVGIPLLVWLALEGKIFFLIFILLLSALGSLEFSNLARRQQLFFPRTIVILAIWGLILIAYWGNLVIWLSGLFLIFFGLGLRQVFSGKIENALRDQSFLFWSIFYLSLFSFFVFIRQLPSEVKIEYSWGGLWMVFTYILVWSCDTLAFFVGKPLGKHKLCPTISPHKTWEGILGGFLGALLAGWIVYRTLFDQIAPYHFLVLALMVAGFGQVGDLIESLLKRDFKVKDTSFIIPGHGGVLDRFDSLLFVCPAIYFYLKFVIY